VIELYERGEKVEFTTYEVALRAYKTDRFTFTVPRLGHVQLVALNPATPKMLRLLRAGQRSAG